MTNYNSQHVEIGIGNEYVSEKPAGELYIYYTDRRFKLVETNTSIDFDRVISFDYVKKIKIDYGSKASIITFIIAGSLSSLLLMFQVEFSVFDIIAEFVMSGGFWGIIAYMIGSFIEKNKWIFRIQTSEQAFDVYLGKSDFLKLSNLFTEELLIKNREDRISRLGNTVDENNVKIESFLTEDKYQELVRLKSLLDQKIITEDEYQSLKQDIIAKKSKL